MPSDHGGVHRVPTISPLHLYSVEKAQKREPVFEEVAKVVELPDPERGSEEDDGIEEAVEVQHVESVLDDLDFPVSTCCLRLPPISAVSEFALFLHAICDVLLLPHYAEPPAEPAAQSSDDYASAASTSHHAVELHPWQPVHLYAGEAELEAVLEAVQVQHVESVEVMGEPHVELLVQSTGVVRV